MYSASIRPVYREVTLQKSPFASLPTAPASLDEATRSSRSPMPRRRATPRCGRRLHRATSGRIPCAPCKKVAPREITRQIQRSAWEREAAEEDDELGAAFRERE
jgi:hypothetical protein